MAELPAGYTDIPEEDRTKARLFFDRGRTVADTGNFEYAIEMYVQGLSLDPEDVEAHKFLREISLKRKASGGKPLGMFDRMKLAKVTKDDKQNLLNFEKLLAYDPGVTDYMLGILQNAHRGGFYDSVLWIGPILQKANADAKTPDFNKFIILKDVYKQLGEWKLATDACHYAMKLHPNNMELGTELKNLGAQHTMTKGGYGKARSFRESMRDGEGQKRLMDQDKDIQSADLLVRMVKETEAEYQADPEDSARLGKYVDALRRTEQPEYEEQAMQILDEQFQRTRQFRFRKTLGEIRMAQLARRERTLREQVNADPTDDEAKTMYQDFVNERNETELAEYQLLLEAYPTDSTARFAVAQRLFRLKRFQDAIPVFQQVRADPKYRSTAGVFLGEAFLFSGFVDEAVDTLKVIIEEYPNKGDDRSREMYYWYGRALEEKKETPGAIKCYSQVAQWEFNYRDVQTRIKRLRS